VPLKIGYHCLPEQYDPDACVTQMALAERCGFDSVWISDHFHPWVGKGQGGFSWILLGAFASITHRIPFGTCVTAPIMRYHPAIVAQAFATLECLFPGRVFLGVGTGEALNEMPVGFDWPNYADRAARLEEAVQIILALWRGDTLTKKGVYYTLRKARLYSKPRGHIPLYIAAGGPKSAKLAGTYGDGVVVLSGNLRLYRDRLSKVIDEAAKRNRRGNAKIERVLELMVSYDADYDSALKAARFWAPTLLPFVFNAKIYDPQEIESFGKYIADSAIEENFVICDSPEQLMKIIVERASSFDQVEIANASPNPETFLTDIGAVLPLIRENVK
jgi:coenzyme F420-dependent glucose-6-phosphate dehydrogenase